MTKTKEISSNLGITYLEYQVGEILEVCTEDDYTGEIVSTRLVLQDVLKLKYFLDSILEEHCDD